MKRVIFLIVCIGFSLSTFAKDRVFYYEYKSGHGYCYYALELNLTHKRGAFYACNCYDKLDYLEIKFSFNYGGSHKYSQTKTKFIDLDLNNYSYIEAPLPTFIFSLNAQSEKATRREGFLFSYDIKNHWNRLEYSFYTFDPENPHGAQESPVMKESMHLSEFFKEYMIDWLPPYFDRVKELQYGWFPEPIRSWVKEEHGK